ncbi:hypothetical protein D3C73_607150 [compost metagenome]
MYPLAHFVVFEVVVNQPVGFEQFAAQATAECQGRVAMHVVLGVFDIDLQLAQMIEVMFRERAVQQVQTQDAVFVGAQFEGFLAGLDLDRTLAPRQARVFRALVALDFVDSGQVLLRTTVGLHVHERVEPGKAVTEPVLGHAIRKIAEGEHVDHVRADTADHRHRAQRDLIDLPPGLVRRVTIVMARDFELGDFEGLLLVDFHPALRQLKHLGLTNIDLQAVIEQFALDTFLVLAALRHVIGTAADQQGAAQGGTTEA